MKWILDRLAEPSTFAGLGAIITPIASYISGAMPLEYALPAVLTGIMAVYKKERPTQ